MSAPVFDEVISATNRAAWLKARREGIGSSDAPSVLGVNPWRSPLQVYAEKLGLEVEPDAEEVSPSEAAYWGSVLEPLVLRRFEIETKRQVKRAGVLLRSRARSWQLTTLDGEQLAEGKDGPGVVEVKCTSLEGRWSEGPPPYVTAQIQHQLAVTGYKWGSVAVLFNGREFYWLDFERDEEKIAWLTEGEKEFWRRVGGQLGPPDPRGTDADKKAIARLFPKDTDPEPVVLEGRFLDLDERRDEIKAAAKALAAEELEIENRFKLAIGEHTSAVLPNGVTYTLKSQTRKAYEVPEATFRVLRRFERKGAK